jgi:hypothetical protein
MRTCGRCAGVALLGACLTALQAQVSVTPRGLTLQPGETFLFHARHAGEGRPADPRERIKVWRWTLPEGGDGSIQEDTGLFSASPVSDIQRIRVRATHRADPAVFGEAVVTVLPQEPFDLVRRVLGQDWLEAWSQDLPFRDLDTGRRFPGRGRVREELDPVTLPAVLCAGYGQACFLRWRPVSGAQAQLLSFRQGGEVVRRDVTGQDVQEVTFRAPVGECTVEALGPHPAGPDLWCSLVQHIRVDVRGVFPFAGNTVAEAGHADGRGLSARFREAFDGVRVPDAFGWGLRSGDLFVSDPRAHVLRRVTAEGEVSTFLGEPDQAGHQDSPGLLRNLASWFGCASRQLGPRFYRPTHLALREHSEPDGFPDREILVSDSGNHVIRRVDGLDSVHTLAGTPGQAGHRDADRPREALFHDPRGIAADPHGRVFVADRGNHVIRRLSRGGQVTTLAGSPGQAGSLDGLGAAARFQDLKGLAYAADAGPAGILYVLDGHAVRSVSLPGGEVRTVLGQVDTPGYRDMPPGGAAGPEALRQPCLRDPMGIRCADGHLLIADQGNHAVRRAHLATATLVTLAGDPEAPVTRWGLLRDALPGPLGRDYAALGAPSAVTAGPGGVFGSLLVCTGRGVAEIRDQPQLRDLPRVTDLACFPVRRDEPCTVAFRVLTRNERDGVTARPVRYAVDFLDPGGGLAERHKGQGSSTDLMTVQGTFSEAGRGTILVRAVTDQGVSAAAMVELQVAD